MLLLTFGAVVWKFILVTGTGAEDSMEMITTSTSGRDGGQSRANVNRTRRLCLSNTVTGNKLPEIYMQTEIQESEYDEEKVDFIT